VTVRDEPRPKSSFHCFKKLSQGIVKITLEDFSGFYEKENKHATALDLSLGALDIEDLLQSDSSPDR